MWVVKYDTDDGKAMGDDKRRASSSFYMSMFIQKINRKSSIVEYYTNYTSESYAYNIAIKSVPYTKQRAAGYHVRTAQLIIIINYKLIS